MKFKLSEIKSISKVNLTTLSNGKAGIKKIILGNLSKIYKLLWTWSNYSIKNMTRKKVLIILKIQQLNPLKKPKSFKRRKRRTTESDKAVIVNRKVNHKTNLKYQKDLQPKKRRIKSPPKKIHLFRIKRKNQKRKTNQKKNWLNKKKKRKRNKLKNKRLTKKLKKNKKRGKDKKKKKKHLKP